MKKSNQRIVTLKGSGYKEIAGEIKDYYVNWLCASGISEEDFLHLVNREDFNLTYSADGTTATIILHNSTGEIAMPLVWQRGNGIEFMSYKVDASLLLMLVSSKCSNKDSQTKITDFLKNSLRIEKQG